MPRGACDGSAQALPEWAEQGEGEEVAGGKDEGGVGKKEMEGLHDGSHGVTIP